MRVFWEWWSRRRGGILAGRGIMMGLFERWVSPILTVSIIKMLPSGQSLINQLITSFNLQSNQFWIGQWCQFRSLIVSTLCAVWYYHRWYPLPSRFQFIDSIARIRFPSHQSLLHGANWLSCWGMSPCRSWRTLNWFYHHVKSVNINSPIDLNIHNQVQYQHQIESKQNRNTTPLHPHIIPQFYNKSFKYKLNPEGSTSWWCQIDLKKWQRNSFCNKARGLDVVLVQMRIKQWMADGLKSPMWVEKGKGPARCDRQNDKSNFKDVGWRGGWTICWLFWR